MFVALFLFGTILGSFLNVVALRYDPGRFLFSPHLLGRSHCPHCKRTLRWYELVPIVSFIAQRGRCRSCGAKVSIRYPLVEIAAGLITACVPLVLPTIFILHTPYSILSALWVFSFLVLLLMSLIDIRWRIIPDEIHVLLIAAGVAIAILSAPQFSSPEGSFVGGYGYLLGLRDSLVVNRLAALGAGIGFFGLIFLGTLGRGMGLGDVKLAGALGVLFGWPDILLITGVSFIVGTVAAVPFLLSKKLRMKSMVPFGPFLAIAALLVCFCGYEMLQWYFSLFGII